MQAGFPYIVTEVDLAGCEHEFAQCSDPFTAGRIADDLDRRIGRWGTTRVVIDGREDESFEEGDEGERFLAKLSDDDFAAFVGRVGAKFSGGERFVALDEFYRGWYGGSVVPVEVLS